MTVTPDPELVSLAAGLADVVDAEVAASPPRSILVVDDQSRMRESLGALLSSRGYDVELAESGDAALARLDCPPRSRSDPARHGDAWNFRARSDRGAGSP